MFSRLLKKSFLDVRDVLLRNVKILTREKVQNIISRVVTHLQTRKYINIYLYICTYK